MDKQTLKDISEKFTFESRGNYISIEDALSPELAGIRIFEPPLIGFASSCDELFQKYKNPEAIGSHYMTPTEWLPKSYTVITFFFHFTEDVVESNSKDFEEPSSLWLHGYKEGMDFIKTFLKYISNTLNDNGMETIVPILDKRFMAINGATSLEDFPSHSSNWSERHAAFAAGLGTFGLSKGIITEKGMAGRLGSVITKGCFEPSKRLYTELYEYCNTCGACAAHCPVNAISLEKGKIHMPCHNFLEEMKKKHGSRGSCGKCQVKAPCTYSIPR